MGVEKRIERLEKAVGYTPGTILQRTCLPDRPDQLGWCLAVGPFMLTKRMFYGDSIDEVLAQAEKAFKINE